METKDISIVQVNVNDLKPAEYNPRAASEKENKDLSESIRRFGLVDPIIVNSAPERQNIVIGGHFRLRIAKSLGYTAVPVVYVNIPEIDREKELNLRLNKNSGSWDVALLADFDVALLKDVGFDSAELDRIFPGPWDGEDDAPDPAPDVSVRLGDMYQLGRHRLVCGDCIKIEDLSLLMAGSRANMVFTDPPYNVGYQGGVGGDGRVHRRRSIKNDKMSSADFYQFLRDVFAGLLSVTDGAFYVCMSSSELHNCWKAFTDCGGHWQTYIIWAKDTFTLSRADYHHQFEPVMYGLSDSVEEKDGEPIMYGWSKHDWYGGRKQGDVWVIDRPKKSPEHPTMKPVALCEKAIMNSSRRGEVVLDVFGGSGSTLIACEKMDRTCYMMELDPVYVDVIIRRWEKFTGGRAFKLNI